MLGRIATATAAPRRARYWCVTSIRDFHRSVGIVGMPNVGKSTLFNALTKTENAQAANYPFCTIDPNIARVAVPDPRLQTLAKVEKSQRIVETQLEFVDIAGLVRGASKGEGLGNKFLDNIRQVAVIAHVVRCFDDTNIIHVDDTVDPLRDLETIRTELILADLQTVEKRLSNLAKKKKSVDPSIPSLLAVLEHLQPLLEDGQLVSGVTFDKPEEQLQFERLQLLTAKKALYLCNVSEDDAATGNEMTEAVRAQVEAEGNICITVSGALEEAAASFEDEASQLEYLQESGLEETGLTKVIRASKDVLQLQTYYTVGEKEARAWNVLAGSTAPVAAGVIHSDFERLFIRAETVAYEDFEKAGSMKAAKEQGCLRVEGKDYVVQEGDIFNFLVGR
jgi:ribosome-binding ATPase